jgi:hypothetical protein
MLKFAIKILYAFISPLCTRPVHLSTHNFFSFINLANSVNYKHLDFALLYIDVLLCLHYVQIFSPAFCSELLPIRVIALASESRRSHPLPPYLKFVLKLHITVRDKWPSRFNYMRLHPVTGNFYYDLQIREYQQNYFETS